MLNTCAHRAVTPPRYSRARGYLLLLFTPHEIGQTQLNAAEVGMLVVFHGKGKIECIACQKRVTGHTFRHAPPKHIMSALETIAVGRAVPAYSAQLEVLVFQDPCRLYQPCVSRNKHRFRISRAEWLQLLQREPEVAVDLFEGNFGVVLELGDEIFRRQALMRVSIQVRSQIRNTLRRQRTAHRVGVTSEPREQLRTRLQRLQQMEGGNRAARAMGLAVFAREHQRRSMEALDHAGRANPNHPAMPTLTLDHQTISVAQFGTLLDLFMDRFDNALLFLLTVAVQAMELQGHLCRLLFVLFGEKLDDTFGDRRASSGIQPGRYPEGNVGGAKRAGAIEFAIRQQRAEAGIHRLAKAFEANLRENSIFVDQRNRIGDGGDSNHLQERWQQSLAPGFDQQGLRNLERYACAAQRLTGIVAASLIGIDHRQRLGHAVGLGQMMIGNNQVDTAPCGGFGSGEGANAGVDA